MRATTKRIQVNANTNVPANMSDNKLCICFFFFTKPSQQSAQQSQSQSSSAVLSATGNDVKKASGAVTIVKLNAQSPPLELHKPFNGHQADLAVSPKSKAANSNASSYGVRPTTPSHPSHGAHVVTIHTSSSSNASSHPVSPNNTPSSNHVGGSATTTAAATATNSPPSAATTSNGGGVGYTRRAKLGDSRSTGRLHSAGNTHRSMTRLNIAGKSVKCISTVDF